GALWHRDARLQAHAVSNGVRRSQTHRAGTVLFIPALVGVRLPSGEFHDGFCFAHDTHEGAAEGIGIFAGFDRDLEHTVNRLAAKKPLRVYQADTDASAVLNRRFKDQFEWSGEGGGVARSIFVHSTQAPLIGVTSARPGT